MGWSAWVLFYLNFMKSDCHGARFFAPVNLEILSMCSCGRSGVCICKYQFATVLMSVAESRHESRHELRQIDRYYDVS